MNVLWSGENQNVMLIDFERSTAVKKVLMEIGRNEIGVRKGKKRTSGNGAAGDWSAGTGDGRAGNQGERKTKSASVKFVIAEE